MNNRLFHTQIPRTIQELTTFELAIWSMSSTNIVKVSHATQQHLQKLYATQIDWAYNLAKSSN